MVEALLVVKATVTVVVERSARWKKHWQVRNAFQTNDVSVHLFADEEEVHEEFVDGTV